MIIDITGVELSPWDYEQCLGNGKHYDECGKLIECCCDECDYYLCCIRFIKNCKECFDEFCPRSQKTKIKMHP